VSVEDFWEQWAVLVTAPQPKSERPDWTAYFLAIADVVSMRADCTRRSVGAVVVDGNRRIVSTGYNGAPSGAGSCLAGDCPRGRFSTEEVPGFDQGNNDYVTGSSYCIAVHAEANALLYGDPVRMRGGTIYISCEPCVPCLRLIEGVGLKAVWRGQPD
jgi:dCMP deaminase